jgi:preprotein translocase subunit SecF
LVVGTVVLGTGPLKDLSLALFVGIAVGAYSSIFIAPSLLAVFKEREPGMKALNKRVSAKKAQTAAAATAAPVAVATAGAAPRSAVQDTPRKADRATGTAPTPSTRPMKATAAGRPQPTRKPRSKRGK